MNLHEYQAKALFRDYGLPVADGIVAANVDSVRDAIAKADGEKRVLKAQVHAGARGKAGGIAVVDNVDDAAAFAARLLGTRLVTKQTDQNGQPVEQLLIEPAVATDNELYLGAVIDRAARRIAVIASSEGGVDIETVAEQTPDKLFTVHIDPITGPQPYQGRLLAARLGLTGAPAKQFVGVFLSLARLVAEKDLSLVEINPLVITADNQLLCLDAKINVDNSALYRHKRIAAMRDPGQENERERRAAEADLNYVALTGNIGCMVNGAGLAMATMDLVKLHGGEPANFLDVGGGATRDRVAEAFKIIVADSNVRAILINIFGGIVRCDLIAAGIIAAVGDVGVNVPVVVRLEGNNAAKGRKALADSGMNIISAASLNDAAIKAVDAVKGGNER